MFKAGDILRIKNLKGMSGSKAKNGCCLIDEMEKFSGAELKVKNITRSGSICFENCVWAFAQEWVEPVKKIIRSIDELDGMENGNGTIIHIAGNFVNIRYKGKLITSTDKKFFDEDGFEFLNSIGFDFEFVKCRSVEEIIKEMHEKYKNNNYNCNTGVRFCIVYDNNVKYCRGEHYNNSLGTIYMDRVTADKYVNELNESLESFQRR